MLHSSCDQATAVVRAPTTNGSTPILATCVLASSLAFIDGSVVNVALPAIGVSLDASAATLQWVVNAYLLPLSALILLGGAAGDRFGRKRLLIFGTIVFALASFACALAPSRALLLAARVAQGAGAAILMPNSLAVLGASFAGEAKGRAIGTWAASGAAFGAIGPVIGGWLIDIANWRAIFLINLPIAAAAIYFAWRYVPADKIEGATPLDRLGGTIVTAGLGALTFGLTIGSGQSGWSLEAVASILVAAVLFAAFIAVEARARDRAMVPLTLFGSRSFVGLSLLTLLLYGALGVLFVLVPYLLIEAAGYSAAAAGAALLPLPVVISIASPVLGGVAGKIGAKLPLAAGSLIVAGGFLLALRIGDSVDYWSTVFPCLLVIAIGMGFAVAPLTTAVLNSVDTAHAGSAAGFNSALARTGGLVATALLGSVLADQGASLVAGFHAAMGICAISCIAASAAAFLLFRDQPPRA